MSKRKRILSTVLSAGLISSMIFSSVQAAISFPTSATKTGTQISAEENRYEITVSVPGAESPKYNETIMMVDASMSQGSNFTSLKNTLRSIGERILNDNGNTKLTLMSFGFSANTIASFSTLT